MFYFTKGASKYNNHRGFLKDTFNKKAAILNSCIKKALVQDNYYHRTCLVTCSTCLTICSTRSTRLSTRNTRFSTHSTCASIHLSIHSTSLFVVLVGPLVVSASSLSLIITDLKSIFFNQSGIQLRLYRVCLESLFL